jgi:hypothetical protein
LLTDDDDTEEDVDDGVDDEGKGVGGGECV